MRGWLFVLVASVAVSALPSPCVAVIFMVDATVDAPDATPADGICATAAGVCTLRAAVQQANASFGEDVIALPAGTFTLGVPGAGEDAAATGDLDVVDDLMIAGAGPDTTIVDGNRLDGVFDDQVGAAFTLQGVTVRGARGNGIAFALAGGSAPMSLLDVVVEGSTGYGVLADAVTAARVVVRDNGRLGFIGGAFRIGDAVVTGNGEGGIDAEQVTLIADSVIANNGGIGVRVASASLLDRCRVSGNQGRGVVVSGDDASVRLLATTVDHNRGGGVLLSGADTGVEAVQSTVSDNEADHGAGIDLGDGCGVGLLADSTISGNRARTDGGGIYNVPADCGTEIVLQLHNVTIVGNVADADADGAGIAGGLFVGAQVTMTHSILAGNRGLAGRPDDCRRTIASLGHNLIGTTTGCTFVAADGDRIGADPLLAPLADNGGPTPTHALLPGSPAIDAGDPGGCVDYFGVPVAVDQRGVTRPQGTACDVGAFEFACGNGVVDPGEECDDGNLTGGDCCSATCHFEPGFDMDGDGRKRAETDAVYTARHLLGLSPVPPSFRSGDPTIPSNATIAARVEAARPLLDVDGDGTLGIPTDVVYIARRLLGLTPVPPSFRAGHPEIPLDSTIAARVDALCPRAAAAASP